MFFSQSEKTHLELQNFVSLLHLNEYFQYHLISSSCLFLSGKYNKKNILTLSIPYFYFLIRQILCHMWNPTTLGNVCVSYLVMSNSARQIPLSIEFSRRLEWVAIPFSRGSSPPRDWTWSPALQVDSLLFGHQESPNYRKYGSSITKRKLSLVSCDTPFINSFHKVKRLIQ